MKDWLDEIFDNSFALGCLVAVLVIILALGVAFGALCLEGWVLMLLWNAILVPLFGFGILEFWWAVGIILICNILFKSTTTITKNKGE